LEAANGPITPQSDKYLFEKNVLVLPDILVNSGSVISSYFEWLKNLEHRIPGNMTKRVFYKFILEVGKTVQPQIDPNHVRITQYQFRIDIG